EETTRDHGDLDVAVLLPQLEAVRAGLAEVGYGTVLRDWLAGPPGSDPAARGGAGGARRGRLRPRAAGLAADLAGPGRPGGTRDRPAHPAPGRRRWRGPGPARREELPLPAAGARHDRRPAGPLHGRRHPGPSSHGLP